MDDKSKFLVLASTEVISDLESCRRAVEEIQRSGNVVAVDSEGVNLGPRGDLSLLQVGTVAGRAYLFDLLSCPEALTEGGLREVLESERIVKVIHDCRNDSGILYSSNQVVLNNVFDTQVAFAILQMQETGLPVHKIRDASLNTVASVYGGSVNCLKEQVKAEYRADPRYWMRRPLSRDMVVYAASDVFALVPQLYDVMRSFVEPENLELLHEMCEERVFWHIHKNRVARRARERKMAADLAELEQKLGSMDSDEIDLSRREKRLVSFVRDARNQSIKKTYNVGKSRNRKRKRSGGKVVAASTNPAPLEGTSGVPVKRTAKPRSKHIVKLISTHVLPKKDSPLLSYIGILPSLKSLARPSQFAQLEAKCSEVKEKREKMLHNARSSPDAGKETPATHGSQQQASSSASIVESQASTSQQNPSSESTLSSPPGFSVSNLPTVKLVSDPEMVNLMKRVKRLSEFQ